MTKEQKTTIDRMRLQGWRLVTFKTIPLLVLLREHKGLFYLAGFVGKSAKLKPALSRYCYRSEKQRAARVAYHYAQLLEKEEHKAKQRSAAASLKASDWFAVGDVVYNSWGYDQTNIDFYQVTRVTTKQIELREIAQNTNDHGQAGGGKCAPRRFDFVGAPFLKPVRVSTWGNTPSAYIPFKHGSGSKWDGRALYCSSTH